MEGIEVSFQITGVNQTGAPTDPTVAMDVDGKACYSYTGGTTTRLDTIRACIDVNDNDTYDAGEPTMTGTKTWVMLDDMTPELAYNALGFVRWYCVTEIVESAVSGAWVFFEVSGANTRWWFDRTNSRGEAIFCSFSLNAGEDAIVAYLEVDGVLGYNDVVDIGILVTKIWLKHYLTSGGTIDTDKGKNQAKITFGGNVGLVEDYGEPVVQWQINFHKVNDDTLDKGHFHTTEITDFTFLRLFFYPQSDPPDAYFNWAQFRVNGRFNGEEGWSIRVRVADFGEGKDATDSIRILLYRPLWSIGLWFPLGLRI